MPVQHIAICVAQVPFIRGGAEIQVDGLADALRERDFRVEIVKLPFKWYPKSNILRNCLAWRLIDLSESNGIPIDAVICTNFPSYVVAHPKKVIWLVHQFRQAYELFGTPYSDLSNAPEDQELRAALVALDQQVIGETEFRYTNAANTAKRLQKFNGLAATPLYPPPRRPAAYRTGPPGNYVLSVGRLDRRKRIDLLIEALARTSSAVRGIIVGEGPCEADLREQVRLRGLEKRVDFRGWIDDEAVLDLYARALAVFFAPFDEDYGYITVEAFLSGKPVVTTIDAGGPLEFVRDGVNGLVCRPEPADLATAIDRFAADPAWATQLGTAGRPAVADITWDRTIETLLRGL